MPIKLGLNLVLLGVGRTQLNENGQQRYKIQNTRTTLKGPF
ncbi:MAG: hypothetical protein PUP91_29975 [Rhizonema sp. PD37]|nr:hypothetical protein [Rhizonema sp. PD37]